MSQIDFYHLKGNGLKADGLAQAVAMLSDKTVASGQKMLIISPPSMTDTISERLWTAKADNFLAHGIDDDDGAAFAPVWITTDADKNQIGAEFACLIDGLCPENMSAFTRIFTIFDDNQPEKLDTARAQWKDWSSEEAHQCRYFAQDDAGHWHLKQ